jgi:hypothetical protein
VSHCGLAIYMEKVSEGKRKNYGNSNVSPCRNITFRKSSKKKPKSFKILL